MTPETQILLSGALTFGVPLAFAVRELVVLRRPPRGGGGGGGPPAPAPAPPKPKPLPDCLIPRPYAPGFRPSERDAPALADVAALFDARLASTTPTRVRESAVCEAQAGANHR